MKTMLLVPAIAALAACQQPAGVTVEKPWVRITPVSGAPSAAYFTLRGGAKDETLTSVTAEAASKAEMHDSSDAGGISRMGEIKMVAVRAKGSVVAAPRGLHVMLFGLKPSVTPGTTTPLTFTFASGQKITVDAKVMPPGSMGPD